MALNRFDCTGLALALAGALAVASCKPALGGQPDDLPESYRLDVTATLGGESHAFTVDHGLSRSDCVRAAAADPMAQCVLEAPPTAPRLVGFGCAGASAPLYAMTESDFPDCASIERVKG